MPEKYHIATKKVARRLPPVGKFGIVDWREDCARCHNCVKKACVYDRYRQEMDYIKDLKKVESMFFECMGCFSCVQGCTKGILALTVNPEFERMGNSYYTPDVIATTWNQADTASIPVSGAGYRGKFTGTGFDSMWTDMSEIVRPTRDGIHGREYISTAIDIGRKPRLLAFDENGKPVTALSPLVDIPVPLIIDRMPEKYFFPGLAPIFAEAARKTGTLLILDWEKFGMLGGEKEKYLPHLVFHLENNKPLPSDDILCKSRLVEIDDLDTEKRISDLKRINPSLVVMVRVPLNANGESRAIELARQPYIEAIHIVADVNGNQFDVEKPKFVKDMMRHIHTTLVKDGIRDEITIVAGGGIALAEHMAKQMLCGADLVSVNIPLLIALECHFCQNCREDMVCPGKIEEITRDYGVGRMTNLIAAWHDQLIEMMGAMGIREARRLRGEAGRAMFFEDLEEETFGRLFGARK
ncbi:MAG TPA: glutamate synthase-related protein [Dehalococcoidales bacterium]|nr:glutamate synthase-related protein [Dehalococcoidales bacterium]